MMVEEWPSLPPGARSLRPTETVSAHQNTPVGKRCPSLWVVITMFSLSSLLWAQTVDLERVQALISSGDLAQSRRLLTNAVDADPRSTQLWAMLGSVCARLEDWSAARDAYDQALLQTPDDPKLLAGLGFVLARQGQFKRATTALQKSLNLDPENASIRFLLGRVQFEAQQFEAAVSNFEQAIIKEPKNETFYLDYAQILSQGQAYTGAEKILKYGLQQLPQSAAIRFELGVCYQKQLKSQRAQQEFRRVIELDPAFPRIHAALASSLLENGQLEEAEPVLETALKINGSDFDARYLYAVLLTRLGRKLEAVAQFRRCLELRADDARVHYQLGKTLSESEEIEAAESELNTAVRLYPEFKEAYLELGRLYSKLGLTEKARQALGRFEEIRQKQEREDKEQPSRVLIIED